MSGSDESEAANRPRREPNDRVERLVDVPSTILDEFSTGEHPAVAQVAPTAASPSTESSSRAEPSKTRRGASTPRRTATSAGTEPRTRDAGPFEEYYARCYADIVRTLSYTLGDMELGREATDEAMARTYARWDAVRFYDNPSGWTYRVGLNWARSMHRRLARQLPLFGRAEIIEPHISDPSVAAAVRRLDVDLRAVVVCRLIADWSVNETAEALGIKPGTVKSRLHRAVRELQAWVHESAVGE